MPEHRKVADIEVVTIPLSEYADLLRCRVELAKQNVHLQRLERPGRSPIEQDPEVAVFIAERLGQITIKQIRSACERTFGIARTPARSSVHRYWQRLRKNA